MFQTKNINYKMLPNDSLKLLRTFALNQPDLDSLRVRYDNDIGWKYKSQKFGPYLNLLKPITNEIRDRNLDIFMIMLRRIEPNFIMDRSGRSKRDFDIKTLMLVPLFDYSRTEKIYEYELNKSVALNSTTCVKTGSFRSINNPYNTTFCYILYMLKQPIDVVEQRML